jgi:hypothetical protein
MKTLTRARVAQLDKGTVLLRFRSPTDAPPDGEYHMRGGICWPVPDIEAGGGLRGFACLAGMHIPTRCIYVMAQTHFVSIEPVVEHETITQGFNTSAHVVRTTRIAHQGLSQWLTNAWAQYYADSYYWHQSPEVNRRYILQVLRSKMIQPKPHLIEVDWDDDQTAYHAILQAEAMKALVYSEGSPLHAQLLEFSVAEPSERAMFPAVHALTACILGMELSPPRAIRS